MQNSGQIELSVIVPVYNCSGWILDKLEELHAHLAGKSFAWELIVVDDCSQDQTGPRVRGLLDSIPNASLISHSENNGKGGAVISGLNAAQGQYRIFTDCDLAYPVSEIDKIHIALRNGADMAIANRRDPDSICELKPALFRQVYSRELFGRWVNSLIRSLGLSDVPDTQAGLKGIRQWLVPHLGVMDVFRFAFDVELLLIARLCGAKIRLVAVRYQFFEKESTVRIFRDGSLLLRDLLSIRLRLAKGYYGFKSVLFDV